MSRTATISVLLFAGVTTMTSRAVPAADGGSLARVRDALRRYGTADHKGKIFVTMA